MSDQYDDFYGDEELPKSKSQIKREMQSLQDTGEALIELSDKDLAKVPLPDALLEAVTLARSLKKNNRAFKRQRQYIGRLMRDVDAEPIEQALEAIRQSGQQNTARFHLIERWRDRLIEEGQTALESFFDEHPTADRQQLRQLVNNARKERDQNKGPKAFRALFRHLREFLEGEE